MVEIGGDIMRLSSHQIGAAGAMLTRAFFDDPKLTHILPEVSDRIERSRFLFEFELRYGMLYGDVWAPSEGADGVAVWLPSATSEMTLWRVFRAGGFALPKQLGKEGMDRLISFSAFVDQVHKEQAPQPHYYLFFIGVDPALQKNGIARRLIRPVLHWLDAQGLPCYLNTQNGKNIGLYEHFSFHVIGQLPVPGSGITHTGMWRDPQR
jgi:ribosomal protein S18 acetylase RimI-like enzyme